MSSQGDPHQGQYSDSQGQRRIESVLSLTHHQGTNQHPNQNQTYHNETNKQSTSQIIDYTHHDQKKQQNTWFPKSDLMESEKDIFSQNQRQHQANHVQLSSDNHQSQQIKKNQNGQSEKQNKNNLSIPQQIIHQTTQNQGRTDQATFQQQRNQQFQQKIQKKQLSRQQSQPQHHNLLQIKVNQNFQIKSAGEFPNNHQEGHKEQGSNFDNKGDNNNLNQSNINEMNRLDQINQNHFQKMHSNPNEVQIQHEQHKIKDDIQLAEEYKVNMLILEQSNLNHNKQIKDTDSQIKRNNQVGQILFEQNVDNTKKQQELYEEKSQNKKYELISQPSAYVVEEKQDQLKWKGQKKQSVSSDGDQKRKVQVQKEEISEHKKQSVHSNRIIVQSNRQKPNVEQKQGQSPQFCSSCIIM